MSETLFVFSISYNHQFMFIFQLLYNDNIFMSECKCSSNMSLHGFGYYAYSLLYLIMAVNIVLIRFSYTAADLWVTTESSFSHDTCLT